MRELYYALSGDSAVRCAFITKKVPTRPSGPQWRGGRFWSRPFVPRWRPRAVPDQWPINFTS